MSKLYKKLEAFSLIEILIVVALMIILATITIIAINPAKNFQDTRNAQRSSDVSAILNAVTQYTSEEGNDIGDLGAILPCEDAAGDPQSSPIGTSGVDLAGSTSTDALVEEFIVEIPMDPSVGDATDTGYTICTTTSGRVEIAAPNAEDKTISVKR